MEQSDPAVTLTDLHQRLDALWNAYLHNLDEYMTCQKLLQKHMSSGFISLARANFNTRNGTRRYGKDFFHERAIASRRVEISLQNEDNEQDIIHSEFVQWNDEPVSGEQHSESFVNGKETENAREDGTTLQQPSLASNESTLGASNVQNTDENEKRSTLEGTVNTKSKNGNPANSVPDANSSKSISAINPLRWFGILVPPDLRSAQTSFSSAVDHPTSSAINAARRMRELEVEIRKVRKEVRRTEKAAGA